VPILWEIGFKNEDWATYSGHRPMFGFLFTLLVPTLLVLRPNRRILALVVACHASFLGWYFLHHQERYLLVVHPLVAVLTCAMLYEAWRSGVIARVGVVAATCAQLAWGADAYLLPSHTGWISAALDLGSSGLTGRIKERDAIFSPFANMAPFLPKGSRVLVHENHVHLGLGTESISDWPQWQGGIDWGRAGSVAAVHKAMRSMGVTHIAWTEAPRSHESLASDLVFYDYLRRLEPPDTRSGSRVSRVPEVAPSARAIRKVAVFTCDKYGPGLYSLSDLTMFPFGDKPYPSPSPALPQAMAASPASVFEEVDYVALLPACGGALPAPLAARVELIATRGTIQLFAPRR
jgi:hypothetical protein